VAETNAEAEAKPKQGKWPKQNRRNGKANKQVRHACQPSKLSNADEARNNNPLLQIPSWNSTEEMVAPRWVDMT